MDSFFLALLVLVTKSTCSCETKRELVLLFFLSLFPPPSSLSLHDLLNPVFEEKFFFLFFPPREGRCERSLSLSLSFCGAKNDIFSIKKERDGREGGRASFPEE